MPLGCERRGRGWRPIARGSVVIVGRGGADLAVRRLVPQAATAAGEEQVDTTGNL